MGDHGMGLAMALFMEAFVSIHMSVFVLLPLSKMISRENSKKIFWILFWIRIAILLCFDFFITTGIAVVDFFAVFVGAFIVTPISIKKGIRITKGSERSGAQSDAQTSVQSVAQSDAQTGVQSGVQFDAQSDTQSEKTIFASAEQSSEKKAVHAADFDPLFAMPEEKCVEAFIKREMQRAQIAEEQDLIPEDMLRRKHPESYFCSFIIRLCLLVFLPFSHDNLCPWLPDPGSICVLYRQVSADEIFEKRNQIQTAGENLQHCPECKGSSGTGLQQKAEMDPYGCGCRRIPAAV